jgi:hypothetical protein
MRRTTAVLVGLALCLGQTQTATAGLYNTEEPPFARASSNLIEFHKVLNDLLAIGAPGNEEGKNSVRKQVLARVKELEDKAKAEGLEQLERVYLSAYYIRLERAEDAVTLLEAVPRDQRDFMVLGNLSAAHDAAGRLDRAEAYLAESLASWPRVFIGLTGIQLTALARSERLNHALLQIRLRESMEQKRGPMEPYPLFPGVRFVGPTGTYEAGLLHSAQWSRVPADALALVEQLVLWMPHDNRLYWLLAELVNAGGDYLTAYVMLDDLSYRRNYRPDQLKAHREILREANLCSTAVKNEKERLLGEKAKLSAQPIGGLLPAGPGVVLEAVGWASALDRVTKDLKPEPAMVLAPDSTPPPPAKAGWAPDWRQIVVSFVAGAVVATLLSMQFREFRRRKQPQSAEPATRT